ncbi:MAG TPA: LysM peptidoglycan-binding domain-containing protein, partial [Anaerolineales bacterium]|nr:LysM peptidoglycan-binding domain-containing protein [Anaerolineales bacterium]
TGGAGEQTTSPLTGQQATMEAVRSALLTQTAQVGQGNTSPTPPAPTQLPSSTATAIIAVGSPAVTSTFVSGIPAVTSAPTARPTARPSSDRPDEWTLQEGEWPYCLARRFDVHPDDLLAINGLTGDTLLEPGLVLKIPDDSDFPGPRALLSHPTNYTVKIGDTIYAIACAFGDVDPRDIASANGLSSPYNLTPGSVIKIP